MASSNSTNVDDLFGEIIPPDKVLPPKQSNSNSSTASSTSRASTAPRTSSQLGANNLLSSVTSLGGIGIKFIDSIFSPKIPQQPPKGNEDHDKYKPPVIYTSPYRDPSLLYQPESLERQPPLTLPDARSLDQAVAQEKYLAHSAELRTLIQHLKEIELEITNKKNNFLKGLPLRDESDQEISIRKPEISKLIINPQLSLDNLTYDIPTISFTRVSENVKDRDKVSNFVTETKQSWKRSIRKEEITFRMIGSDGNSINPNTGHPYPKISSEKTTEAIAVKIDSFLDEIKPDLERYSNLYLDIVNKNIQYKNSELSIPREQDHRFNPPTRPLEASPQPSPQGPGFLSNFFSKKPDPKKEEEKSKTEPVFILSDLPSTTQGVHRQELDQQRGNIIQKGLEESRRQREEETAKKAQKISEDALKKFKDDQLELKKINEAEKARIKAQKKQEEAYEKKEQDKIKSENYSAIEKHLMPLISKALGSENPLIELCKVYDHFIKRQSSHGNSERILDSAMNELDKNERKDRFTALISSVSFRHDKTGQEFLNLDKNIVPKILNEESELQREIARRRQEEQIRQLQLTQKQDAENYERAVLAQKKAIALAGVKDVIEAGPEARPEAKAEERAKAEARARAKAEAEARERAKAKAEAEAKERAKAKAEAEYLERTKKHIEEARKEADDRKRNPEASKPGMTEKEIKILRDPQKTASGDSLPPKQPPTTPIKAPSPPPSWNLFGITLNSLGAGLFSPQQQVKTPQPSNPPAQVPSKPSEPKPVASPPQFITSLTIGSVEYLNRDNLKIPNTGEQFNCLGVKRKNGTSTNIFYSQGKYYYTVPEIQVGQDPKKGTIKELPIKTLKEIDGEKGGHSLKDGEICLVKSKSGDLSTLEKHEGKYVLQNLNSPVEHSADLIKCQFKDLDKITNPQTRIVDQDSHRMQSRVDKSSRPNTPESRRGGAIGAMAGAFSPKPPTLKQHMEGRRNLSPKDVRNQKKFLQEALGINPETGKRNPDSFGPSR